MKRSPRSRGSRPSTRWTELSGLRADGPYTHGVTERTDQADDPRARWRELPAPITPDDWSTEQDDEPVPGSVQVADGWEARLRRAIECGG